MSRVPQIRVTPEDFVVDEIPLYPATGQGAHTFVRIEKRLRNTDDVARELARAFGVSHRDVGYAGRKDRDAVTRQWFSLPGVAPERALGAKLDGARILEAALHPHKLRTGHLRANRFEIRVRDVDETQEGNALERLSEMIRRGMPNRFGAQRFGRGGANPERARRLLAGDRVRGDRRKARFLISALQSAVFNTMLERRSVSLDQVEPGDVAQVCESGGLFLVEDVDVENERAARFEISATGPIFGSKMKAPEGEVAAREAAVMLELGVPEQVVSKPPRGVRLRGTRRPFRVAPEESAIVREEDAVVLRTTLPPGSYVSVMLEELFPQLGEGIGEV